MEVWQRAHGAACVFACVCVEGEYVAREFARCIDWVEPSAGPISFPRFKSDEFDATWLCTKLRDDSEVLILPGQVYGDAYRDRFRIAFGRGDAPQAIEAFRHGFAELAAHL